MRYKLLKPIAPAMLTKPDLMRPVTPDIQKTQTMHVL